MQTHGASAQVDCGGGARGGLAISLLTASFPPKGGSGVQRPYYQAKFLSRLGWKVSVVTVEDVGSEIDLSFPDLVPNGVEVIRLPVGMVPSGWSMASKLERRIRRRLFFPDEMVLWAERAVREVLRSSGERRVAMASVGSPSAMLALRNIKASDAGGRIRTVVDFRDFWALNQRRDVPEDRRLDGRVERRRDLERDVLKKVDGVVVVSNEYRRRLLEAYPWLSESRVLVVENGFVEQDFEAVEARLASARRNPAFTIRYTGYLLKDHDPATFFEGLALLKERRPQLFSELRFEYYGGGPSYAKSLAERHGVGEACVAQPYVPHARAIELMLTADALYLPFAEGEGTIGGKTYEYLRSGRPLIATLHGCDEPRHLLERFGVQGLVPRGNSALVAARLEDLISVWLEGGRENGASPELLVTIERERQTAMLSEWLQRLVVGQG